MVGWHHWLNGHDFEHTPGDSEGQGSLVCCSPWSCKESDTTEQLNDNKLFKYRVPTMDYQGWPREGVVYHLESSWQLCKVGVNKPTKRSEAQTLQLTQSHPQHQSQSLIPHPDDLLSFRQPSVRHSAKHSGGTQRGLVLPISYSATYYHIFFPFFLFFFFFKCPPCLGNVCSLTASILLEIP